MLCPAGFYGSGPTKLFHEIVWRRSVPPTRLLIWRGTPGFNSFLNKSGRNSG